MSSKVKVQLLSYISVAFVLCIAPLAGLPLHMADDISSCYISVYQQNSW